MYIDVEIGELQCGLQLVANAHDYPEYCQVV